jgi:undecaprenyl-diphosphatase
LNSRSDAKAVTAGRFTRTGSEFVGWLALFRRPRRAAQGRRSIRPFSGRVVGGTIVTFTVVAIVALTLDAWMAAGARQAPPRLVDAFEFVTQFGKSGWFLWPTGLALLALAFVGPALSRTSKLIVAALAMRLAFVLLAVGIPGLVVSVIKRLIGRARPYVPETVDPYLYQWFVWQSDYASLPSGHATTAFSAAVAIGALWPQARIAMWTYAAIIAVSRVMVTAHFPSDVLAGAVCGAVGALLVREWFANRRLGFVVSGDGRIHAMAGPGFRRLRKVAREAVSR